MSRSNGVAYRRIYGKIWTDPWFCKLSLVARLLWLYLITNEHSHPSGLYTIRKGYARLDLDLSPEDDERFDAAWEEVFDGVHAHHDHENRVVWISTMHSYQGTGGPKVLVACARQAEGCHSTRLASLYLDRYPEVMGYLSEGVSIGYGNTIDGVPDSVSNSVSNQKDCDCDCDCDCKGENKSENENVVSRSLLPPAGGTIDPVGESLANRVLAMWNSAVAGHRSRRGFPDFSSENLDPDTELRPWVSHRAFPAYSLNLLRLIRSRCESDDEAYDQILSAFRWAYSQVTWHFVVGKWKKSATISSILRVRCKGDPPNSFDYWDEKVDKGLAIRNQDTSSEDEECVIECPGEVRTFPEDESGDDS